jgi:hypothetical protein
MAHVLATPASSAAMKSQGSVLASELVVEFGAASAV